MAAYVSPNVLCLTNRTGIPASLTPSWQELFDTSHEISPGNLKSFGKFKNCSEGWTVFAALQQTHVLWVIATLERELFLGELPLLPQLAQCPRKGPLLRRTFFICKWHPQHRVCGLSINTSTNYTIHGHGDGSRSDTFRTHPREAA